MSVTNKTIAETLYGEGLIVHILSPVKVVLDGAKQTESDDSEGCGVLIGSLDSDFSRIWIEELTTCLPNDKCGRNFFHIQDSGHQKVVMQSHRRSKGQLRYLGTWHSHPEEHPTPSQQDKNGWGKVIKENPEFHRFIFIIIGHKSLVAYVPIRKRYAPLKFQQLKQ